MCLADLALCSRGNLAPDRIRWGADEDLAFGQRRYEAAMEAIGGPWETLTADNLDAVLRAVREVGRG
jgi:hypothetical protein